MEELTTTRYSFGDFELDGARRLLLNQGEPVSLNYRTFELLFALVSRRGETLSKDDLLATVWEGQFVEEGNLTVHISALRKALGESKNENKFIVTVPGRGYSFVAELNDAAVDDIIIESHTRSEIFVEEEIDDGADELGEFTDVPALKGKDSTLDWFKQHWLKVAIPVLTITALLVGGYFLMSRNFARNAALPPQQMSIKRLTTKGTLSRAALSPDGKLFVYSIPEGDQESLWLGHVDGGEPVQIRPPESKVVLSLRFAPDGSSIYYVVGENFGAGTLYKMPVFGGAPEKIRSDFHGMSFSADGKQFVFLKHDETGSASTIHVADTDGSNEREIAVLPGDRGSNWGAPVWAPDGSTIMIPLGVKMDDAEIFAINVKDGSTKQLNPKVWRSLDAVAWLHDGSGVIAAGMDKDAALRQLWFIAFPGGEVRRLTNDLTDWGYIASIANDDSLLVIQGISQSNIWAAPANNLAEAKQITFGSTGKQDGWDGLLWTPDGRIVYVSNIQDGSILSIMNADGSKSKQIVPNGGNNRYPSITADGRTLFFQSNRSGHFAVWRTDIDGENMVQVTGDQIAGQPFVSPDGKWLLYNTHVDSEGELWRMPLGGGEPQRVNDKPSAWAQISPDSKLIACESYIDNNDRLAIFLLETGEVVRSFDIPRLANLRLGVHWTPDGRSVTYRDWANGIWRQNLDGGEPQRLNGLPEEKLFCYGWSPDGRNFAFTRGNTTRDAVLITGIK